MTDDALPPLMTVDEAAVFLQVPKSWIYERTRTGAIPTRKLGRHVRIPSAELRAWLDLHTVVERKTSDG